MILPMMRRPLTAEHVSEGHPDKCADQVADRIYDEALHLCADERERASIRTGIEILLKDNLGVVSGEARFSHAVRTRLDVIGLARQVWAEVGYEGAEALTVIDHIRTQSPDIASGSNSGSGTGVDGGGAGDQGIMIGYATDETPEMMPREYVLARNICLKLRELRLSGALSWLRSDTKSQVTVDADGKPLRVIVAAQHNDVVSLEELRAEILCRVVRPVLECEIPAEHVTVNGTGKFVIGGPVGDAGVVGRKVVVDAYGPRIPVGGGAYSGKDPTKVDRSAAYMARHIAKALVAHRVRGASEALVQIAYGIGRHQPEMVAAVTDAGVDVSDWVRERFPDLSPRHIIDRLGLLKPVGWSYAQTASYGHYGRPEFPWEAPAEVR